MSSSFCSFYSKNGNQTYTKILWNVKKQEREKKHHFMIVSTSFSVIFGENRFFGAIAYSNHLIIAANQYLQIFRNI